MTRIGQWMESLRTANEHRLAEAGYQIIACVTPGTHLK